MSRPTTNYQLVSLITNVELSEQLNKFFDSDSFVNVEGESLTEEETMCEEHYIKNHQRDVDGRYVVKIPFKNAIEKPDLGESKRVAFASLLQMEKRFAAKPELKIMYSDFMKEYIITDQMRKVLTRPSDAHYLPDHCIFKESTTTKLRVVFNASQKMSNGKSLNEQLALGPMDQNNLLCILLYYAGEDIELLLRPTSKKCIGKYAFMTRKHICRESCGDLMQMIQWMNMN